jgi:hypothetical protein
VLVDADAALEQHTPQPSREPRRLHGRRVGREHGASEQRRANPVLHLVDVELD